MSSSIQIIPATAEHLDGVQRLYSAVTTALENSGNPAGWFKDVYPIREDATAALAQNTLFVALLDWQVAGTTVLNQRPEPGYVAAQVDWQMSAADDEILVIHTLAVHPDFQNCGVGRQLVEFAESHARQKKLKAIRFDTYVQNTPAQQLYERLGYSYRGTYDIGYAEKYGLELFKLYEKVL